MLRHEDGESAGTGGILGVTSSMSPGRSRLADPEVPLSHGDDPATEASAEAASGGRTDSEGLRLPDSGPVAQAPKDAGRAGEPDDGPDRGRPAGLAERRVSDRGSDPDDPRDIQSAESISVETEIVGFAWSAPLPAPTDLGEYERIVPGSALRILAMTETTISGPIENTARLTAAEIEASNRGLSFAIRLTSAMAFAAVVFFALGVAGVGNLTACITAGSVCLSIPVVMLVRSFITRS